MISWHRVPLHCGAPKSAFRCSRPRVFGQRRTASHETNAAATSPRPLPKRATVAREPAVEAQDATPIDIPSSLWYQRLGPVTQFLSWFHRTQTRRPYVVQVCTSLTVYLVGDLLAQEIGGEEYDAQRTMRMLTIGAVASIPGYRWFLFLGNHFNYASRIRSIATKVVVQQIVFTPIFNSYFFGMQAALSGEPPSGIVRRIQQTVPISIVNSLKLWPAVTAFSFAFIMPQYRFMFSGVFAVCWQTYLSYLNRREEKATRMMASPKKKVNTPRLLEEPPSK